MQLHKNIVLVNESNRYIGAKRNIADFEKYQQKGPITKVIPTGAGAGVVIAVLTDKNYKVLNVMIRA